MAPQPSPPSNFPSPLPSLRYFYCRPSSLCALKYARRIACRRDFRGPEFPDRVVCTLSILHYLSPSLIEGDSIFRGGPVDWGTADSLGGGSSNSQSVQCDFKRAPWLLSFILFCCYSAINDRSIITVATTILDVTAETQHEAQLTNGCLLQCNVGTNTIALDLPIYRTLCASDQVWRWCCLSARVYSRVVCQ